MGFPIDTTTPSSERTTPTITTTTTTTTTTTSSTSSSTPTELQCPVPEKFYSFSGHPATNLADCAWDFSRCSRSPSCCQERWERCCSQVVRYKAQSFSNAKSSFYFF